jgi:YbbR domain-containing protein
VPLSDPIRVINKVAQIFQKHGIDYLVGGSLASSLHGIPRATQDVDIVADLSGKDIGKIAELLSVGFFVDEEMMKKAVSRKASFNIIEKENIFKVDIFVMGFDEASITEMSRRVPYQINDDNQSVYICSAEDIIAHKLYWYKLAEGISERQWNDALNVIKVQKNRLDIEYLKQVCSARGVTELLEKALQSL